MGENGAAARYFSAIEAALGGLDIFLRDEASPFYRHDLVAQVMVEYIARLTASFECWRNRLAFAERFRIARAESGFPVYQNVLELENDGWQAPERLQTLPEADAIRREMADFILRRKEFPAALRRTMAERLYLEKVAQKQAFGPFILPKTCRVSVNPKTRRPFYVVHWGVFDGVSNLPLVYMAGIEDSSEEMVRALVGEDGRARPDARVPLPVDGLLNPSLAHEFDSFAEKNSAFSLSPATIATNLDRDFDTLHPKQLRRIVLGPFYSAGITEHNHTVSGILDRVRDPANAWLLTWTVQEVYSSAERPARRGLWSSEPARQEFLIETGDIEAARQGVSTYERHALIPHEAYQLLYASGEAARVFDGYSVHILSHDHVITEL